MHNGRCDVDPDDEELELDLRDDVLLVEDAEGPEERELELNFPPAPRFPLPAPAPLPPPPSPLPLLLLLRDDAGSAPCMRFAFGLVVVSTPLPSRVTGCWPESMELEHANDALACGAPVLVLVADSRSATAGVLMGCGIPVGRCDVISPVDATAAPDSTDCSSSSMLCAALDGA